MAAAAALGAVAQGAGSFMSSLVGLGGSLGSAKITSDSQKEINTQNINWQKEQMNTGLKSFRDAGMPEFAYFSNPHNLSSLPNTQYHLGGTSFQTSYGSNLNLTKNNKASSYAQNLNMTRPNLPNTEEPGQLFTNFGEENSTPLLPMNNRNNSQNSTLQLNNALRGQLDRQGLGIGRYSNVAPPVLYSSLDEQVFNGGRIPNMSFSGRRR